MTVTVLDLSHHNTITDWAAIRNSGVAGVVHKFSQGTDYKDPKFRERRFAASGAGLLFGRYHFGDSSDVHVQVNNFLEGWFSDLLLALDWEDIIEPDGTIRPDKQMTPVMAEQFVERVHNLTGVWPALYTGNRLKDAILAGFKPVQMLHCRLWLAQWGAEAVLPAGWDKYYLWQHTNQGAVPGITGNVDMNWFDSTEAELRASWAPSAVPETPVVTAGTAAPATVTITLPAGSVVRIAGDVTIERA